MFHIIEKDYYKMLAVTILRWGVHRQDLLTPGGAWYVGTTDWQESRDCQF